MICSMTWSWRKTLHSQFSASTQWIQCLIQFIRLGCDCLYPKPKLPYNQIHKCKRGWPSQQFFFGFLRLFTCILFCVYECFVCMYVHMCVSYPWSSKEDSWKWIYRWLWVIKPGSQSTAASTTNCWTICPVWDASVTQTCGCKNLQMVKIKQ